MDSLIHGRDLAPIQGGRSTEEKPPGTSTVSAADIARRGAGSGRAALVPSIADELTGLYLREAWAGVLAAEDARWMRYRRPCQVIQLEVSGIAAVADRLGEAFAQRLLTLLAEILRDETRQGDLYARSDRWRIQGMMPEQEPDRGRDIEERIRDRFRSRLGPELPFGLLIGMASPTATGGISEALGTAERAMRPGDRPEEGAAPTGSGAVPGSGRPAGVHDGLVELGSLRGDGLITEEEFRLKRAEILARL